MSTSNTPPRGSGPTIGRQRANATTTPPPVQTVPKPPIVIGRQRALAVISGVTQATALRTTPGAILPCGRVAPQRPLPPLPPRPKHWLKVRLKFKDTNEDVPATPAKVVNGTVEALPGPLTAGLIEGIDLDAGTYEVSFPEIDAAEWNA